ncbi:hypothetical protein ACQ4PT_029381 [Festuca glaucescens]
MGESIFDSEVVPSSLVEIAPILRVANEVEAGNPRVAYLCRFYAFEKAHRLDPTPSGGGVRQFKTALLQRLERENDPTLKGRAHQSDAREMQRFYGEYYNKYIQAMQNAADKTDRALLTKAYQTAAVLFKVLKAVDVSQSVEVDQAGFEGAQRGMVAPGGRMPDFSLPGPSSGGAGGGRRLLQTQTVGNMGESIFDSEVVPSSLVEIAPILRIANEAEAGNPRVAYLCRFYAFEKAHRLDPTSSGRGVRQFTTALLQRLERENDPTLKGRVHQSDAREMHRFYGEYIQALQNAADKTDHALLTKALQTEAVLFEVLKAVSGPQSVEVNQAILDTHNKIEEKKKLHAQPSTLAG